MTVRNHLVIYLFFPGHINLVPSKTKHKYAVEFLFPFIYKSNTQMSIIHCTIRFLAGKAAGIFIQS